MLEVAHEQRVRRIAVEVRERPRGSLNLAVGCSAEVRAAVEAALGEREPGILVVRVTLDEDHGPWTRILAALEASGRPASEVVLSVAGLGDMAEGKVDPILAQLNLGRELRVVNRLHVLLWVGQIDRLDRFRTAAPDLWGHRSGVALFLSHDDFDVPLAALVPAEVPKDVEAVLRETEEKLASSPQGASWIRLLNRKAACLNHLGRMDEALHALQDAESVLSKLRLSPRTQADEHAVLVQTKLGLLASAGRTEEAFEEATTLEQDEDCDPLLRYVARSEITSWHIAAGRVREGLTYRADVLAMIPTLRVEIGGGRSWKLAEGARLFASLGALEAAVREAGAASGEIENIRRTQGWDEEDEATRPGVLSSVDYVLAEVGLQRGDTHRALDHAHRRLTREGGFGSVFSISGALDEVADMYHQLGLFGDARRFAHQAITLLEHHPGTIAEWTRKLGILDEREQQMEMAISRYQSALSLYLAAAALERMTHERARWLRLAARTHYDALAPLVDASAAVRHFEAAEELLGQAMREADEAASPEVHAITRWWFATLARRREQWARAEAELLSFLTWAEAHWGPYKRAQVLLDLAEVARERVDLSRAAEYAERARREVDLDPPEWRNRFVAIDAARELARIRKAQGQPDLARASLDAALTLARGDGLRLREREILLDLADLPRPSDGPDPRLDHAQRARSIAQDAAFPVDEAEAMLVLAEIHLDAGHARRARSMFDQASWIVDRIGTRAVRKRAARVRDRLGG